MNERVRGVYPVSFDVHIPDEMIEKVRVFVDDLVIYEGSAVPEKVMFDSAMLPDGRYEMHVEVERKRGDRSSTSIPFVVENTWELFDGLQNIRGRD